MRRRHLLAAWILAAATLLAPAADAMAADEPFKVTVRRSAHGIPHILANDWASAAYGYGRAIAEDNICVLADTYTTVRAERSRYFGPDKGYVFRGNGSTVNNLNSDFFFKRIIDQRIVEELISQPPPAGPVDAVREGVRGYVAGYNAYLAETGVDNLPDPACRGEAWVKPIEEIDAYRRFYQLALLASSGVAIDGIGGARPLTGSPEQQQRAMGQIRPGQLDEMLGGIGSNAYGLGSAATKSGGGMLLGNPHFPWDGAERFYQAHLTIPEEGVDVAGGSLFGVPLVLIGHTRGMAWSHTVSTARRFTIFEEKLVPGSPTTYLVDGQPKPMKATKVTVDVRGADGKVAPQSRTLYETEHGWMITSILGLPVFPWSATQGYSMGDVNKANFRYLNHFFETNRAQTVDELHEILKRYQGIPWVNTIAADSRGKAYYADIGAVPHVTDDKIASCSAPLGVATDRALRVQVLDGFRSACNWGSDPDAAAPGILGPGRMPFLFRDDFTSNMNDSYWLTNPAQPLEGYPRIIGDERTVRSPRTRLGLRIAQQRLDATDGVDSEPRFSLQQLQDAVFNNRQYLGELWRDELVAMCERNPTLPSSSGAPVDVSEACPALKAWNLRDDLDSRGAVLFRRFAGRALGAPGGLPVNPPGNPGVWRVPFDPEDPVNTPRGLNSEHPQVKTALADAVRDLRNGGIPLDAPLGDHQSEKRNDEVIPIHGGPGGLGVFNAISASWNGKGYPDIAHGSSFVQTVELKGACPTARTILTYSQSTNRESPFFGDQTRMYSRKQWNEPPFCNMAGGTFLRTLDVGGGVKTTQRHGRFLRSVRVRGRRVSFRTYAPARVTITLRRAGRRVQTVTLRRTRGRSVTLRGLRRGRYEIQVRATVRGRTHTVQRVVRRR